MKMNDLSKKRNPVVYAAIVLAIVECITPFMTWIRIPSFNDLSSLLGGSGNEASKSLIGLLRFGQSVLGEDAGAVSGTLGIILFFVGAAIAANIMFVITVLIDSEWHQVTGLLGSTLLLVGTGVLYATFQHQMERAGRLVELLADSAVEITFVPYLAVVSSVANLILILVMKKLEEQK